MCVLASLTLLVGNIRLPRQRLVEAVTVAEAWLAVVLLQHINHERNALFHGMGGLGAAHIGLNPARCDNELGTAIIGTMSRIALHKHIARRFAGSIEVPGSVVAGDAAQLRGHCCDCPVRRDNILKHLDQPDRTERVYQHHVEEILDRSRAGSFLNRLGDAGIDEQHVERTAVETLVQCTNAGLLRDVRRLLLEAGREAHLKVIKGSGLAANGADDVPIAATILLDERQAEASRCSNNQDGWLICHCGSPIVTIFLPNWEGPWLLATSFRSDHTG